MGGHTYAYDGLGNRVSQTVTSIVTRYLLDMQPGLVQVISATSGSATENYIHTQRGIHATRNAANNWVYTVQDGLGSVRAEIAANADITARGAYEPYGLPTDVEGAYSQPFRFTGEMLDSNALQYHRARYYNARASVWASLDPFEGYISDPLSLNGFSWVNNNSVNDVDPTGLQSEAEDRAACETNFSSFECKRFRARQAIQFISQVTTLGSLINVLPWWGSDGLDLREAAAWIIQNEILTTIITDEPTEWLTEAIYRTLANSCSANGCTSEYLVNWYAAYTVIIADYTDRSNPSINTLNPIWTAALFTSPSPSAFRLVDDFAIKSNCSWNAGNINTGIGFQKSGGCYKYILSNVKQTGLYVTWWDENEIPAGIRQQYRDFNNANSEGRMENTCFAGRYMRGNTAFFIGSQAQQEAAFAGTQGPCTVLQPDPTPTPDQTACLPTEITNVLSATFINS